VLLLTATPLEEDALGFFRLLQLLRPEEFPEDATIDARIATDRPLPPCTSATRRVDVGGLPPRAPRLIDLSNRDFKDHDDLVSRMRGLEAEGPVARKTKLRRIRRALACGAALAPLLDASDGKAVDVARRATRNDPRIAWLVERAPGWRRDGDKTLVFVAHRESLDAIKTAMSRDAQIRVGVFHEDLSPGQRDIEVAQFRLSGGPSMLVSTECGGEGRNFEFCTRLVLFDMPWSPMTVEQRIGRLDRIGRQRPVEILIPQPPSGLGAAIVELYDSLGLYRRPMAGLEPELAGVERAIENAALGPETTPDLASFADLVDRADAAYGRIERAAQHELHRDPFRPEMADEILSRIPEELEELTQEIVLGFCERFDLNV